MFRSFLLAKLDEYADKPLLNCAAPEPAPVSERETYLFADVKREAVSVAAWLTARGVQTGDKVAIIGYNTASWIVAFTAINLLGAVPVVVNAAVQPDSMLHCLKLTQPKVILADAISSATLSFATDKLKEGGVGPVFSWQKPDHLKKKKHIDVIDFKNMGTSKQAEEAVLKGTGFGLENLHPESDGVIFFTSGTTGYPKAVLSSQRAALHSIVSGTAGFMRMGLRAAGQMAPHVVDMIKELIFGPKDDPPVTLMAVPFFHVTGLSIVLKAFEDGIMMVTMRKWDVEEAVRLMTTYKINSMTGVPAILLAVMQSPNLPKDHQLLGTSYGGAPAPERMAADVKERWPDIHCFTAWGMTETNAAHTIFGGNDYIENPAGAGFALPVSEVRIVDIETKEPLPDGKKGLILARGMTLMKEYYNDANATAKSFDKDGWFDTGDAGYLKDGILYVADRIKDIIIRGGENISSEEVENAVFLDNRVGEAAAVAVPHDILGEEVAVAVSLRPGAPATTAEEIRKAAHGRLRSHARPVFVVVYDELLPRNHNGKIVKTEVKKTVQELYKKHKETEKAKAKL